jgi:hypothetical protein
MLQSSIAENVALGMTMEQSCIKLNHDNLRIVSSNKFRSNLRFYSTCWNVVPSLFPSVLLQGILFEELRISHVVPGRRIRPSSLRKGALFHAPSTQQPR